VLTQLVGAIARALIAVVVIATPSLLIPGTTPEGTQVVTLVALALGVFVGMEYAATYPGLVEFRDAPPFNRVRILTLFLDVVPAEPRRQCFARRGVQPCVDRQRLRPSRRHGARFPVQPGSDDRLAPAPGAGPVHGQPDQGHGRDCDAGDAVSIFCFALLIRLNQWPNRGSSFNVWINLPTFDPTTGGDVVKRLRRDSLVNVILGVFAPFVLPVVAVVAANHIEINVLSSPHALVWGITLWMFIPLSMLMRGPGHVAGRGHDRPAARAAYGLRRLGRAVLAGLVALAVFTGRRQRRHPPYRRVSHRVVPRRAGPFAS
jgi:hypothetical protein